MGWASGTSLAQELADIIEKYVPKKDHDVVGSLVLKALTDRDWDCVDEVEFFDKINRKLNPQDYEWENEK